DGGGQPTHRTATRVDQAGLPSQPVTVLDHAHHVPGALTQPTRGRDDMNIGVVTVEIVNLLAQPTSDRPGVQLGLDHDPAADDVQPSGKAQHRGDLRSTRPELTQLHAAQLILDGRRHRHKPLLSSYPDQFTATPAWFRPLPLV